MLITVENLILTHSFQNKLRQIDICYEKHQQWFYGIVFLKRFKYFPSLYFQAPFARDISTAFQRNTRLQSKNTP